MISVIGTACVGLGLAACTQPQAAQVPEMLLTWGSLAMPARSCTARSLTLARKLVSMRSTTTLAPAQTTGLPPKVEPKIGLVVFAGESFTQCPLTTDQAVLVNLLREVKSGMIQDGTAIGLGLANAVNRLKDSPGKSKVVILLTDGINNQGAIAPVTAAELAKAFGIRVYTIGVGTYGEAPYPVPTPFGVQLQNMPVEIDEGVLQQIANVTGGKYFRATDNDKLQQIYSEIDQLEKSKIEVKHFSKKNEQYFIFGLLGMCLLIAQAVLKYTLLRKIP